MKGASPTVTFRIAPLLLASVRSEIERLNRNPLAEQWTISDFITVALVEKVALNTRRRKTRRKKGQGVE
jgi:hypothetical protein